MKMPLIDKSLVINFKSSTTEISLFILSYEDIFFIEDGDSQIVKEFPLLVGRNSLSERQITSQSKLEQGG